MTPTTVEGRLLEWAYEKFYPGWAEPSPSAVLANLMDTGRDERLRKRRHRNAILAIERRIRARRGPTSREVPCKESRGVRMEMVVLDGTTTVCPPDGGLGAMVERMANSLERSRRCRELGELLNMMPRDLWTIVWETYYNCPSPRDIPRTGESAAKRIGIAERTYYKRKKAMIAWLEARLPEFAALKAA